MLIRRFIYISCRMWGSWYHRGMPWLFICYISLHLIFINLPFFIVMWCLLDIMGSWFWKYSYIRCSVDYISIYIIMISLTIFLNTVWYQQVPCLRSVWRPKISPHSEWYTHTHTHTQTNQSTWNTLMMSMINFFYENLTRN
jgi:hypothetical protein